LEESENPMSLIKYQREPISSDKSKLAPNSVFKENLFENIFGNGFLDFRKVIEKCTLNVIFSSTKKLVAKIFDIHKKVFKFGKTISIFFTER